ncbi:hypothetical protein A6A08_21955 [Nocardiopsis sp. TSRI0078]|uniref:hypothetical protein n=1 Tax=unclassified Nocardiopsis TaxID=2649073 RepID=UPI0009389A69|nr:hypothetical protein [Nocardiopsis sp. TSRI0078]OKI21039.1 hypothetical protein A6A08_21955 [Nocardiopsis sp. TSRI0078]
MPRQRGGLGSSGLHAARDRIRQAVPDPPAHVDLVDDLLAPGSVPPLLTVEEATDVLQVLDAAAAAAPHTPAGARITELADRLRVRLYAAEHPD